MIPDEVHRSLVSFFEIRTDTNFAKNSSSQPKASTLANSSIAARKVLVCLFFSSFSLFCDNLFFNSTYIHMILTLLLVFLQLKPRCKWETCCQWAKCPREQWCVAWRRSLATEGVWPAPRATTRRLSRTSRTRTARALRCPPAARRCSRRRAARSLVSLPAAVASTSRSSRPAARTSSTRPSATSGRASAVSP